MFSHSRKLLEMAEKKGCDAATQALTSKSLRYLYQKCLNNRKAFGCIHRGCTELFHQVGSSPVETRAMNLETTFSREETGRSKQIQSVAQEVISSP